MNEALLVRKGDPKYDEDLVNKRYIDRLLENFTPGQQGEPDNDNDRTITSEPTGFTNNENITVTYNSTTRKVTLTGTFEAYYKGEKITELVDGWESPAHADIAGTYFLHYCGGTMKFDTSPWTFDCLQIAFVQYNSHDIAIRETHGFMQWQSHEELHNVIGTYRVSGGDLNSYVLNSTTAVNRRPDVNQTVVRDEDLLSTLPALTSKTYTQRYLSGNAIRSFNVDQAEIIPVNGNIPYYNQNVNGTWQQTLIPNNNYAAIFVVAVPTTSDTNSQKYRYMFVQPQQIGVLSDIQALTPNNLTHGDTSNLVSEFVFVGKIIIQVSGNNWTIYSVELLSGTRLGQVATPSGNYLTLVNHDTTMTGNGTAIDPLSVSDVFVQSPDNTINNIIALTKAEYDAIPTKDPNTLYNITDEYSTMIQVENGFTSSSIANPGSANNDKILYETKANLTGAAFTGLVTAPVFKTLSGTQSCATSTPVQTLALQSPAMYLVTVYYSANEANNPYFGFAIISTDGTTRSKIHLSNFGTNVSITMVNLNMTITQTSGITLLMNYSVTRIV